MNKHGVEGFLNLFFTNYFYEVTVNQAKSYLKDKKIDNDIGFLFYKFEDKIGSYDDLTKFEDEIKKECNNISKRVVEKIKEDYDLEHFIELEEDKFSKKLHEIIDELHKEVDIEK